MMDSADFIQVQKEKSDKIKLVFNSNVKELKHYKPTSQIMNNKNFLY